LLIVADEVNVFNLERLTDTQTKLGNQSCPSVSETLVAGEF
jgi:hypothetical protein